MWERAGSKGGKGIRNVGRDTGVKREEGEGRASFGPCQPPPTSTKAPAENPALLILRSPPTQAVGGWD